MQSHTVAGLLDGKQSRSQSQSQSNILTLNPVVQNKGLCFTGEDRSHSAEKATSLQGRPGASERFERNLSPDRVHGSGQRSRDQGALHRWWWHEVKLPIYLSFRSHVACRSGFRDVQPGRDSPVSQV